MADTGISLIVGLGNPGQRYVNTRHNAGAWFVNQLVDQHQLSWKQEAKFFGAYARLPESGCWLFKPATYMNESGRAVSAFLSFYQIDPTQMLVAHDEVDFESGVVKLKEQGGHGGHNGLRNIISAIHSKDFYRLRIGVGHPGHKDLVSDYVLHPPSKTDATLIQHSIDDALQVLPTIIQGDFQQAMHALHSQ